MNSQSSDRQWQYPECLVLGSRMHLCFANEHIQGTFLVKARAHVLWRACTTLTTSSHNCRKVSRERLLPGTNLRSCRGERGARGERGRRRRRGWRNENHVFSVSVSVLHFSSALWFVVWCSCLHVSLCFDGFQHTLLYRLWCWQARGQIN